MTLYIEVFMFGPIGFQEIVLVLVLALLIFGPKKIPEIARSLGKGFREFKQSTSGIVDSFNQEMKKPVAPPPKKISPPSEPIKTPDDKDDEDEVVINLEKESKPD